MNFLVFLVLAVRAWCPSAAQRNADSAAFSAQEESKWATFVIIEMFGVFFFSSLSLCRFGSFSCSPALRMLSHSVN